MQTSHPPQAVSAADIEKALKGVDFPKSKQDLVKAVASKDQEVRDVISELPEQQYRDAAEVSRAFGEIRTHEKASTNQPSKTGGQRAMESSSAARFASLFKDIEFPASVEELKAKIGEDASDEELMKLEKFAERDYESMADIAKEFGRHS